MTNQTKFNSNQKRSILNTRKNFYFLICVDRQKCRVYPLRCIYKSKSRHRIKFQPVVKTLTIDGKNSFEQINSSYSES